MKWRYFLAAAISVSIILIANGVPYLPVLAGCGAVAALNIRKKRTERKTPVDRMRTPKRSTDCTSGFS